MSEDMKSMKAPKIEVRAERRYVIRVAGTELSSRFKEVGQMCGLKQLIDEDGRVMVVDTPNDFMDIVSAILGDGKDEFATVGLIKASPQLIEEIQAAVEAAKSADEEPVRTPVGSPSEAPTVEREVESD